MRNVWEIFNEFAKVANEDSEHIFADFMEFLDKNYIVVERGGKNGHRQNTRTIRETLSK